MVSESQLLFQFYFILSVFMLMTIITVVNFTVFAHWKKRMKQILEMLHNHSITAEKVP
jgi:hypothetical protein